MRGKKGEAHLDPADPPRRRGNRRRGHGTYENDRPPILGVVGRRSGQVHLRVVHHTDHATLKAHVYRFTRPGTRVYSDEWRGDEGLEWPHETVHHGLRQWARDGDGDGHREVHINTTEGMWADVRTFLRPFKGVHKRYLSGYVAMAEFRRNLKRISPAFISAIVHTQSAHFP
nr:transposase [Ardenticatena sp.]